MKKLRDLLGKQQLFFDGGTGTILQGMGLKPGELPETWNLKHPDRIVQLHYNYFLAGANIIKTDTFGAFITKFPLELERIIKAAIENANECISDDEESDSIDVSEEDLESTDESEESIIEEDEKTDDLTSVKRKVLAFSEVLALKVYKSFFFETIVTLDDFNQLKSDLDEFYDHFSNKEDKVENND